MKIADIIEAKPKAEAVFEKYGLHCAHCELGQLETLEEGAERHGLTKIEIKDIIKLLNV